MYPVATAPGTVPRAGSPLKSHEKISLSDYRHTCTTALDVSRLNRTRS